MRSDREPPTEGASAGTPDAPREPREPRPSLPPRATTGDGSAREPVVAYTFGAHEPAADAPPAPADLPPPAVLPVVEVESLDWDAVRAAVDPAAVRARARDILDRAEALLDREDGPGFLFDADRASPDDRAIHVRARDANTPLWIIGDLHGDLLTLEAALATIQHVDGASGTPPQLVFLGDLFDDGGYGLEVLLRVFEIATASPGTTCIVAGNHDEALAFDGTRFTSSVSPSDFADRLDAEPDDDRDARGRAGGAVVRDGAARAVPAGRAADHARGFPLVDLHAELEASGDWNAPQVLSDFAWTRAHPKARKKLPNRASRGSQYGYEDFAAFCALATRLGRRVTHLARGHDHVEERWAVYPAYAAHPVLTTVALSRRLEREVFGPYVRVPTIARWAPDALPQVHRLHVPEAHVRELYPEPAPTEEPASHAPADTPTDVPR